VVPQRSGRGESLSPDARRILVVQALRAFAYGLGSVLIGVTLSRLGLSGPQVGLVLGALLAGSGLASIALARLGDRLGRRRWYVGLLLAMGVAGTVFALTGSVWLLVLAALTGTVSTEVVESGPFTSLEQAMLPSAAEGRDVTHLFGTYNTIATLAGSAGALAAVGSRATSVEPQLLLLAYPLVAGAGLAVALGLSPRVEPAAVPQEERRPSLDRSRGVVLRLGGLFALDSFGGGFVTQAFLAYWFTERFDTSPSVLGIVFFGIGVLQAGSFQLAVRLAVRVGLLNTMVFTHLPSNVLLALIPLAPGEGAAIALLLARFALSQMDVPTRQAYLAQVVDPDERTAAAGLTNTARTVVRPLGPLVSGPILTVSLGAPFVIAGALKSAYDLGLYAVFRQVPVPGESRHESREGSVTTGRRRRGRRRR
jgi:MFS family permease